MKIKKIGKLKRYKTKEFKPVIEKCKNCGSKLELDKNDIEENMVYVSKWEDKQPWSCKFVCPICNNIQYLSKKNFLKYWKYYKSKKIVELVEKVVEE